MCNLIIAEFYFTSIEVIVMRETITQNKLITDVWMGQTESLGRTQKLILSGALLMVSQEYETLI